MHSPFYRHLCDGLPTDNVALQVLPPVTTPELMASFDDWAADRRVSGVLEGSKDAQPFRGAHLVCGSAWKKDPVSGVIGVEQGPLIPMV